MKRKTTKEVEWSYSLPHPLLLLDPHDLLLYYLSADRLFDPLAQTP